MQPFHFLSLLADDSWQGPVRTFLLISVGPQSRDTPYARFGQLLALGGASSLAIGAAGLTDFFVRAVPADNGGSRFMEHLCELARDQSDPCPVALTEEAEVLALAAAEALPLGRLLLSRAGRLQVELLLPDLFDGHRTLAVDGTLDVQELEAEFRVAF